MELIKESKALSLAVKALKEGGVIISPTDTVYGFLADARNREAVAKIFKIKNRPRVKPLPVFVKDIKMAKEVALINEDQEKLLKKYWPGKYTFVLKRKKGFNLYGVRTDKVALRIPNFKVVNDLLDEINFPLAQTSVNLSNLPSLVRMSDIVDCFGKEKKISLIIDGGNLSGARPSKIIDLTVSTLTRLR